MSPNLTQKILYLAALAAIFGTITTVILVNQGGSKVNNNPVAIDKSTPTPPLLKLEGSGGVNTANVSLIAAAPNANKELMYLRLERYLADGNFRKADEQTWELIIKIANNGTIVHKLSSGEVKNFSCNELNKIDSLWTKYSDGQFGISVQRAIYASVGGNVNKEIADPISVWKRFAIAVGWKTGSETSDVGWIKYDDLIFDLSAQKGHLPSWKFSQFIFRYGNCNL